MGLPLCHSNQMFNCVHNDVQSNRDSKPSADLQTASLFSGRHQMLYHHQVIEYQTGKLTLVSLSDNMQHGGMTTNNSLHMFNIHYIIQKLSNKYVGLQVQPQECRYQPSNLTR